MIRGESSFSQTENRKLETFPNFSINDYLKTVFQEALESALKDQLLFSAELKHIYNNIKNKSLELSYSVLNPLFKAGDPLPPQIQSSQVPVISGQEENVSNGYQIPVISNEEDIINKEPESSVAGNATQPIGPYNIEIAPSVLDGYTLLPKGQELLLLSEYEHLIFPHEDFEESRPLLENKINNINAITEQFPDLKYYLYYIETDYDADFVNHQNSHEFYNYIVAAINEKVITDVFPINKTDDLTDNFFKTDHHWNNSGQLKGYSDIVTMLGEESIIETEMLDFPGLTYYGYKARLLDEYKIKDEFGLLYASLDSYDLFLDGAVSTLRTKESYYNGIYSQNDSVSHYSKCNGYDYGEIVYDFHKEEKENILIFVDSYSNPINDLIASHYNKTFIIDMRHYKEVMGHPFSFERYVEENNISTVLFTGYFLFYANDAFLVD
ncbi:MAG TPA: hypothetical protein P5315_04545 [Clostridia bacterium]|nr:hypothetical protein [Clostridia bacterium]